MSLDNLHDNRFSYPASRPSAFCSLSSSFARRSIRLVSSYSFVELDIMLSNVSEAAPADESIEVEPPTQLLQQAASPRRVEGHESDSADDEDQQDSTPPSQQFHPVKAIIAERSNKYLVAWEGTDENGKAWTPTWEPKANVTPDVIEEWMTTGRAEWKRNKRETRRENKQAAKRDLKGKGKTEESGAAPTSTSLDSPTSTSVLKRKVKRPDSAAPSQKPKSRQVHVLSDTEETDAPIVPAAAPNPPTSLLRKRKSMANLDEPAKQRVKTAAPAIEVIVPSPRRVATELKQSSRREEPNAELESIVPDSQGYSLATGTGQEEDGDLNMDAEEAAAVASPARLPGSSRPLPRAFSPAASSDVEVLPSLAHPPTLPSPTLASSVPSPQITIPASSQNDPIEDPDSSPPRRPLGPAAPRRSNASPAPSRPTPVLVPLVKPARPQLELVLDDASRRMPSPHSESDVEDDEENQPSSWELSYVSQPVAVGAGKTMPMLDPVELEEMMDKYEKPALPVGGAPEGAVGAAAGAGPSDAGEGGDGGHSRSLNPNEGYTSSSSTNYSSQQPHRSDGQAISRSGSSNGHGGGSGGGGGGGGYYGGYGGYPPYGPPYGGYGYPPPPGSSSSKRELENDSADDNSKKARTSQRPTPEPEHDHRLPPPPPMAPMYHYPAPYPGYPPYPPPPHGYPFPPPMPGYHQPPPFIPVPSYSPPLPPPNQNISPSLARVLGPTTTGPNPIPLVAPQAQNPAPPNVIAPSPTGATTPVGAGSPVPSPAIAAVRSPLRQRSQSPAAALKSPSIARASSFAVATGAAAVNSSAAVSRNASPAPGGGSNLDGLINLVLASPHIEESDQTKAEIVRFLKDPKAYISRPDQPLSQTPHWAFELRRMTHEGVDKTDFIIIHSGTGTHQLKRVARSQATFDFARSLSHNARASTPAAEAGPPSPPAVSTMTREQLEKELESLRLSTKAQLDELTLLRPLATEVPKLRTDVEKLTKTNKSLTNSKETAQSDYAYMQAQYQDASTAAVARAREATIAEEETAKLRGMLDVGLKQRDLVAKGESKALREELRRMKAEVQLCRAAERRVQQSGVLEKASKWDEYVAREKYDAEMYKDRERALLEEEEEEEREREREEQEQLQREQDEKRREQTEREMIEREDRAVNGDKGVAEVKIEQFACEWRVDKASQVEPCGAILDSRDALQQHLLGHLPLKDTSALALDELP
ncbi:hypothetical protein BCR35DRAFT_323850, partial [Leucosporidium creatinivorum]